MSVRTEAPAGDRPSALAQIDRDGKREQREEHRRRRAGPPTPHIAEQCERQRHFDLGQHARDRARGAVRQEAIVPDDPRECVTVGELRHSRK
jgi:hypothetical protein